MQLRIITDDATVMTTCIIAQSTVTTNFPESALFFIRRYWIITSTIQYYISLQNSMLETLFSFFTKKQPSTARLLSQLAYLNLHVVQ
jgi:hypothetical protein